MKIVIIIPTYNERDNIGRMIEILETEIFPKIKKHKLEILVVDDTSPDETYEVVERKMKDYKNLHLLLNPEKIGLGGAYIKGFKHALSKLSPDYVIEMDSDFQHDPNDLPKMIKAIEQGGEYVIGARFIKGGSIPKDWGFKRIFLSRGGNIFSRLMLGLISVHDITSGFKATKVKGVLDKMELENILSKSYAYKIHMLYMASRLKAKIVEVPITFANREKGWSKMEGEDFKESLRVILRLRFPWLKSWLS